MLWGNVGRNMAPQVALREVLLDTRVKEKKSSGRRLQNMRCYIVEIYISNLMVTACKYEMGLWKERNKVTCVLKMARGDQELKIKSVTTAQTTAVTMARTRTRSVCLRCGI